MDNQPTAPGANPPPHNRDWSPEIHDGEVYLMFKDIQAGVLFPQTGLGMDAINRVIATLNAYYPTEPAHRG